MSDPGDPDFQRPSSDENTSEGDLSVETQQVKRKRRKRKTPAEWKQNIPRDKRLNGLAHISRRGIERARGFRDRSVNLIFVSNQSLETVTR